MFCKLINFNFISNNLDVYQNLMISPPTTNVVSFGGFGTAFTTGTGAAIFFSCFLATGSSTIRANE